MYINFLSFRNVENIILFICMITEQYLCQQVHYKFELMNETLFLTVNIIDRFLEQQPVARKKLQLVGVTAMLLACKYEEISVPLVDDFVLISDKAYTTKEVLDMVILFILLINILSFSILN